MNRYDWKAIAAEAHNNRPYITQRPVIGITGNFGNKGCELAEGYWQSVLAAGATPLIIPPYENIESMYSSLQRLDALILSGGSDLNPLYIGQEPWPELHDITPQRDLPELLLVRMAFDMQLPLLGICRGAQVMAMALGGSVHQDIARAMPQTKLIKHSQELPREYASHSINIAKDSLLKQILGEKRVAVNSFHHQAVENTGKHLRVSANAPDGIIEAIESNEHKPILGVQWHPECFILRNDHSMIPLFQWLSNEAILYRRSVNFHEQHLSLDSHCDTPMKFHSQAEKLTTLPRMKYGHLDSTIMVAYLPQGERNQKEFNLATEKTNQLLDEIDSYIENSRGAAQSANTPHQLYKAKALGKCAIMKGIENGYAIGKELSNIAKFQKRGVVYITLCHNGDNDICDSARGNTEHNGLSQFGRDVIQEMNRMGIMVDLSHASEKSFWDTLEISQKPVICSHSSCKALTTHPRNLSDEQMRALAANNGVMQITLYEEFISIDGQATISQALDHIEHAIAIMGIEHVGIGTDFDGDGGVPGIAHAGEIINLTRELFRRGYNEQQLRLLWGENLLRVMRECQKTNI